MVETHSALRESVVLITVHAEQGWFATRKDFQVDLEPADALFVSEEPHQGDLVKRLIRQYVCSKPSTFSIVEGALLRLLLGFFTTSTKASTGDLVYLFLCQDPIAHFALVQVNLSQEQVDLLPENVANEFV